jgi:Family of unknown function (DUF5681)
MPQNRHKAGFRGPSPDVGRDTQFKPGQSGNPGGRPKKTPYTDAHRLIAEMVGVADLNILPTDTIAECVAKIMAREALKGKVNAAKEIADRTDGTPRQTVEISGQDGSAAQVGTRLSATDLIRALRDIYGLSSDPGPEKSVAAHPPQQQRS